VLGLNYNRGQKILIRLRPAGREDTFYEFEDLIGTMLHEVIWSTLFIVDASIDADCGCLCMLQLTHNVHGPHDDKFYAFLKKLNEEYDELQSKGYTGTSLVFSLQVPSL
jgi:hypothetical protein